MDVKSAKDCVKWWMTLPGTDSNPRTEHGATFLVQDNAQTPIAMTTVSATRIVGFTGLETDRWLDIRLSADAGVVELTYVHTASPPLVEGFYHGSSVGIVNGQAPQQQAETLTLNATAIDQVLMHSPLNETLLLEVCFGRS
jgi:hypothetical protein